MSSYEESRKQAAYERGLCGDRVGSSIFEMLVPYSDEEREENRRGLRDHLLLQENDRLARERADDQDEQRGELEHAFEEREEAIRERSVEIDDEYREREEELEERRQETLDEIRQAERASEDRHEERLRELNAKLSELRSETEKTTKQAPPAEVEHVAIVVPPQAEELIPACDALFRVESEKIRAEIKSLAECLRDNRQVFVRFTEHDIIDFVQQLGRGDIHRASYCAVVWWFVTNHQIAVVSRYRLCLGNRLLNDEEAGRMILRLHHEGYLRYEEDGSISFGNPARQRSIAA